jgi:hypothetical protein
MGGVGFIAIFFLALGCLVYLENRFTIINVITHILYISILFLVCYWLSVERGSYLPMLVPIGIFAFNIIIGALENRQKKKQREAYIAYINENPDINQESTP